MLASVSWHLVAVRADSAAGRGRTLGAEKVTAGVQSGIAHGARAGTSLLSAFPQEICRLAAGWLSEGARAPTISHHPGPPPEAISTTIGSGGEVTVRAIMAPA